MKKILCGILMSVFVTAVVAGCGGNQTQKVLSVEKIESVGLNDKYEISYSDGSKFYFTVENGADGKDGTSLSIGADGFWYINGIKSDYAVTGKTGPQGQKGEPGTGISGIYKTASEGNKDIYTIMLTDGSSYTFEVTNARSDKEEETEGMLRLENIDDNYSPAAAGNKVLENALIVTASNVKGAHDAQFVIKDGKAYIVYEANDVRPGEASSWDFVYCAMSVVDIKTNTVEKTVKFSENMQQYANETLMHGCTFVPRITVKDEKTLRLYFASEDPGVRQSLTYFIDYDIAEGKFGENIYRLQLKTDAGTVDFTPQNYIDQTLASGHRCFTSGYGAFLFDIFDECGKKYIALNNYANGQNALAVFNDGLDCVEIIGHIGEGTENFKTTESGIMRKNDGSWMSVLREEKTGIYRFSYSLDGEKWSYPRIENFAKTGTATKATLNNFCGTYFMSWADSSRSCMRFMYSADALTWTDLITVYSPTTFQYPSFVMYENEIYYTATMGDKETIVFGKLPIVYKNQAFYVMSSEKSDEEKFLEKSAGYNDYADIKTNANGTVWSSHVKRDALGIYFRAETSVTNKGDKIFFMLDVSGSSTGFTSDNFMFKFQGGDIQYQGYYEGGSGKRGYKNLAFYDGIMFFRKILKTGGEQIFLFIPYDALKTLSPDCKYTETEDMFFTVYGANGSFVSNSTYCGKATLWNNPSTYCRITYDNKIVSG